MNKLKDRMRAGETTFGTWVSSSSVEVADALASLGFDWLVVDLEHGSAGVAEAAAMFVAAERHGCAPLARLTSADPFLARRLLDNGAHGLIVPVVESAEAFRGFARHCFYPPEGRRGVALGGFNRWGDRFADYMSAFRPILVPQIETRAGVAAAESIAALPEVDALFFGPYDLSSDLGAPGNFAGKPFADALERVKAACAKHGKAAGGHQVAADLAALQKLVDGGFRFLAYGTDLVVLRDALKGFRALRPA